MRIALFGGTFDPIHCGHLAAARAARDALRLDQVHFIPSGRPPHRRDEITCYEHRYTMVALACAGEPAFVPSLLETPQAARHRVHYSILTVRRFRRRLGKDDRLFFIIGADAFLEFRTWRKWRELLNATDFVVISRPGFPLESIPEVLPRDMRRREVRPVLPLYEIPLRRTSVWVLAGVEQPVSATDIRQRAAAGKSIAGLVPPAVADYILKLGLYS